MTLPLFTDEAIYVRWSQIAKQDAAWRFISLTDGKQPMFVWIAMNMMRVFKDPLFASRMVSVAAGFGTLLGVFFLASELFKKRTEGGIMKRLFSQHLGTNIVGLISASLFIFFPFALVYDRMALYDSLVACTIVWSIYMEVILARYVRLDIAILSGIVIGSSMLTKTSGFFGIYLFPISLLLFDFKQKTWRKKIAEWVVFFIISVSIAYSLYSILRLSPFYYIIDEKNALFVRPLSMVLYNVKIGNFAWFNYIYGNFNAIVGWFITYVGLLSILTAVSSLFLKEYFREKLFLFLWFLIPFVALGVFGNTLYPRFIYFMTVPVLVLVVSTLFFLYRNKKMRYAFYLVFGLILLGYLYADKKIILDFPHAPIPQADLGQYINSWPAGGGIKEMIAFFDKESKNGKIYVATQGTFGSLPTYAVEIYLGENKNIEKKGYYPLPENIPQELVKKSKSMPVYFVFNDSEFPPATWPLELRVKYQKGIGDRHLSIYQIVP